MLVLVTQEHLPVLGMVLGDALGSLEPTRSLPGPARSLLGPARSLLGPGTFVARTSMFVARSCTF